MPKVIDFNAKIHTSFFRELSESGDYELFSNQAIRKIIDYLHPIVIRYTVLVLFVPYFFYVLAYIIYTSWLYGAVRLVPEYVIDDITGEASIVYSADEIP